MMSFVRFAVPGVALLLGAGASYAAPDMKPGLWEVQVRTEMAGMPMQMPSVTTRQCIRKQDMVPQTNSSGQDCEVKDQSIQGNTVSWRIDCKSDQMQGSGTGKITYQGDTFKGRIDMTMQQQGSGTMHMSQHMQGKRVGDCQ